MTISNTTNAVIYTGDSVTVDFPYAFKIFEDSDLVVSLYEIATATESVLTLDVDYTVSGAGDDSGGTVSLLIAAPASTHKIIITRTLPITQETDYVENDPFPAESHENALDKLTMICQQIQEQVNRALLQDQVVYAGTGDLVIPAPVADKILGWNATGDALENKDNPEEYADAAEAAQLAAEAAQTAAELAETNSETAETNAEAAETAAEAAQTAAEAAQLAAEAAAAGVNLPAINAGDANKILQVKADETGHELRALLDENDMASDSDTRAATQQSIKAYVDSQVGGVTSVSHAIVRGFELAWLSTTTISVRPGTLYHGSTQVNKTAATTLDITANGDYIGGASQQGTSRWLYVYVDASGNIKLEDSAPDKADTAGNTVGTLYYGVFTATYYRCIGAIRLNAVGAGEINKFFQIGNTIAWDVPVTITSVLSAGAWSGAISCATGMPPISTYARFGAYGESNAVSYVAQCLIRANGETYTTNPQAGMYGRHSSGGANSAAGTLFSVTDASQQINHREDANTQSIAIDLLGYIINIR